VRAVSDLWKVVAKEADAGDEEVAVIEDAVVAALVCPASFFSQR
jgi:hypothetical protein